MQQPEPEQQINDAQQPEVTPEEVGSPSLEQQLAEAQRHLQDCRDSQLRTQADFVNYRRRAAQERAEVGMTAQGALMDALWPVLDDLGRALESAPPELAEQPWVQGIHLVSRRLATTLERLGVRPIGAPGEPFDPRLHEAIMTEGRSDMPEGTVVKIMRPGYVLGERVLRPAQVVVAAAPEATAVTSSEG